MFRLALICALIVSQVAVGLFEEDAPLSSETE